MTGLKFARRIITQAYIIILPVLYVGSIRAETTDSSVTKVPSAVTSSESIAPDTAIHVQSAAPKDSEASLLLPWNISTSADSARHQPDTVAVSVTETVTPVPAFHHKKKPGPVFSPAESLYAGTTPEQDYYARLYVRQVFAFSWEEAEKSAKRLQRIERKDRLLPLSALLTVSARVFRILSGEYENDAVRRTLLHEIDETASRATHQLSVRTQPDSLASLTLFIDGGIRGLCAALEIETNAVAAAVDGFTAFNRLERLFELSPDFEDAWLGYGLFYCSLARAPAIVRAALTIGNRPVSFDGSLDYLRRSAYRGRYTSELAKLYLIQFLSPYWGHLVVEKDRIFANLRQQYPGNPYYVFLATDEDICFHPERIDGAYVAALESRSRSWKNGNYSLKRYSNLVKYQIGFLDTASVAPGSDRPSPDTALSLREFTFYPLFLEALREHRRQPDDDATSMRKRAFLTKDESAVMRNLGLSAMSSARKNLYEWHIRDALKLR